MRQLLLWSFFIAWMMVLTSCHQKVKSTYEITLIDNKIDDRENATIDLADVFYAKANWESKSLSQLEQGHSSSFVSRGTETSIRPKTKLKKPHIRFANEVYDFGFVDEGELVAHSFRMHNDGPGTWKIEEVLPSCVCTNVKVNSTEIVSGAYLDVSFNLETTGRPGAQQKLIEIFSNAGYHRLLIKGGVYPPQFSQKEEADAIYAKKDSI